MTAAARELWGRVWSLRIGSYDITELDFEASVQKSTKREPNKCSLTVYNLRKEHRDAISRGVEVEVNAGYQRAGGAHRRFLGAVKTFDVQRNDVDVATKVEATDKGDAYRRARVSRSFAAGTTLEAVVRHLVSALDVGTGNLEDFARGIAFEDRSSAFPTGYVVSGSAQRELTRVLHGAGLRWSVQNGVIQIAERGRPVRTTAVRLAVDTGLIGSPTVGERGKITAVTLLQPDIYPGSLVVLESDVVTGQYTVSATKDDLKSRGAEWRTTLELRPY